MICLHRPGLSAKKSSMMLPRRRFCVIPNVGSSRGLSDPVSSSHVFSYLLSQPALKLKHVTAQHIVIADHPALGREDSGDAPGQ